MNRDQLDALIDKLREKPTGGKWPIGMILATELRDAILAVVPPEPEKFNPFKKIEPSPLQCLCGRTGEECESIIEGTHQACCIRCVHLYDQKLKAEIARLRAEPPTDGDHQISLKAAIEGLDQDVSQGAPPLFNDQAIAGWNIGMLRAIEILQSLGAPSAYVTHDGKDPDEARATQDAWGKT